MNILLGINLGPEALCLASVNSVIYSENGTVQVCTVLLLVHLNMQQYALLHAEHVFLCGLTYAECLYAYKH